MKHDAALDRRTFWPRAGPAGHFVPDLGDERPCANCGYNLRGLPFDSACPECGATGGIVADAEEIPWNERRSIGAYLQTVMMVLTSPGDLAGQIWARDVLWRNVARRFRRINVVLATISVCAVVVALTARQIGLERAIWCAPVDAVAVLWWFIVLSGDAARFFADKGVPTACRRSELLADYISAVLILSLLHPIVLALTGSEPPFNSIQLQLVMHGGIIAVQILLMASAQGSMLWQLVELPRAGSFVVALGSVIISALKGALYVVVFPWIFAGIAVSIG